MMRLIYRIEVNTSLNNKAKELESFLRLYEKCLIPTEKRYKSFLRELNKLLEELNAKYKRTKPFEIYGKCDNFIAIYSGGFAEDRWVARGRVAEVKNVLTSDSIVPAGEFAVIPNCPCS